MVEHLVGIGRRSALVHTAHFLVELGLRLELAGLGSVSGFACPLNQYLLPEAVGLTAIHVNRILRQLREQFADTQCDTQRRALVHHLQIFGAQHDHDQVGATMAFFQPTYLASCVIT